MTNENSKSLKDYLKAGVKIKNEHGFIEIIYRVESFPCFRFNYVETIGIIGGGLKLYKIFIINDNGRGKLINKVFEDNFNKKRYTGLNKFITCN